jgi:hypothetical protein
MLTRETILKTDDRRIEPVKLPEWGGELFVRNLSGTELSDWQDLCASRTDPKTKKVTNSRGLKGALLVAAACDADGAPVFQEGDAEWLEGKNAAPLNRVWDKACEMSGIGGDEKKKLEKNSDDDPTGDSGSS